MSATQEAGDAIAQDVLAKGNRRKARVLLMSILSAILKDYAVTHIRAHEELNKNGDMVIVFTVETTEDNVGTILGKDGKNIVSIRRLVMVAVKGGGVKDFVEVRIQGRP